MGGGLNPSFPHEENRSIVLNYNALFFFFWIGELHGSWPFFVIKISVTQGTGSKLVLYKDEGWKIYIFLKIRCGISHLWEDT